VIGALNRFLSGAFDLALAPLSRFSPVWGLALTALVTSVGMLLIFKVTSNQSRLVEVKRRLHAGIYEIRLFRDDARAIWRAQFDILKHSSRYLWLSLPPLLWMIVPLFLVIAQLQFRFGYTALEVGSRAIVTAEVEEGSTRGLGGASGSPGLELQTSSGVAVDAPRVWIPVLGEANWRIVIREPGSHSVRVAVGEQGFDKIVDSSPGVHRRSPVRPSSGLVDQLIYPAEPPLDRSSPLRRITVEYPELRVSVLGWETHWLIAFLIFTFAFTLILRTPLRVTI
jgi:uncharacterized membrane protein (DUF106 family)